MLKKLISRFFVTKAEHEKLRAELDRASADYDRESRRAGDLADDLDAANEVIGTLTRSGGPPAAGAEQLDLADEVQRLNDELDAAYAEQDRLRAALNAMREAHRGLSDALGEIADISGRARTNTGLIDGHLVLSRENLQSADPRVNPLMSWSESRDRTVAKAVSEGRFVVARI